MAITTTSRPWDGSPSRFDDDQWRRSCLLDRGPDYATAKQRYALPVREPDGTVNLNALRAASAVLGGARGGVQAPPEAIAEAKRRLAALMRQAGMEPGDHLLAELETEDIRDVEILAAVGPIHGHGSPPEGDTLTVDDLREFERSWRELSEAGELRVPVKIGHSRAQRLAQASGLAVDEEPALGWVDNVRVAGDRLLADLRAVPRKLAALIKAGAFRTRSVEFKPAMRSQATGRTYRNVLTGLALLGAKAPAVRTLDDIVALYGDDQVDEDGIRTYDHRPDATTGAALRLAIVGDDEVVVPIASIASGLTDTGGSMTELKLSEEARGRLAAAVGVDPDALDADAVIGALEAARKALAEAEAKGDSGGDTGVVKLSEAELAELRAKAEAGERAERRLYELERAQVIERAIRDGKIEPAHRERWERLYDADSGETERLLAELAPNELYLREYGSDADGLSPEHRRAESDRLWAEHARQLGIPVEAS